MGQMNEYDQLSGTVNNFSFPMSVRSSLGYSQAEIHAYLRFKTSSTLSSYTQVRAFRVSNRAHFVSGLGPGAQAEGAGCAPAQERAQAEGAGCAPAQARSRLPV